MLKNKIDPCDRHLIILRTTVLTALSIYKYAGHWLCQVGYQFWVKLSDIVHVSGIGLETTWELLVFLAWVLKLMLPRGDGTVSKLGPSMLVIINAGVRFRQFLYCQIPDQWRAKKTIFRRNQHYLKTSPSMLNSAKDNIVTKTNKPAIPKHYSSNQNPSNIT